CRDGDVVTLSTSGLAGATAIVIAPAERLATGHLAVEGSSVGEVGPATLRTRRQLAHTGVVVVAPGPAALPGVRVHPLGVSDPGPALSALCTAAEAAASGVLAARPPGPAQELQAVDEDTAATVARTVRRTFALKRGVKPTVLSLLAGREVQYDESD